MKSDRQCACIRFSLSRSMSLSLYLLPPRRDICCQSAVSVSLRVHPFAHDAALSSLRLAAFIDTGQRIYPLVSLCMSRLAVLLFIVLRLPSLFQFSIVTSTSQWDNSEGGWHASFQLTLGNSNNVRVLAVHAPCSHGTCSSLRFFFFSSPVFNFYVSPFFASFSLDPLSSL